MSALSVRFLAATTPISLKGMSIDEQSGGQHRAEGSLCLIWMISRLDDLVTRDEVRRIAATSWRAVGLHCLT